jgi:hypothetical protein
VKNKREQDDAVAAAHIHEASQGSEVVSCGDRGTDELGHVCHGVVEDMRACSGSRRRCSKPFVPENKVDTREAGMDDASFIGYRACAR